MLRQGKQEENMGLLDALKLSPEDKEKRQTEKFMSLALKEAEKAFSIDEVPIGCVIVKDGKVIAKGYNKRNKDHNVVSHAEMIAISDACKKIHDWRLDYCTMYVTLEPCPMCAGAIVQARMKKVVIGTMNEKGGCAGSVINLLNIPGLPQQVETETGVMQAECSEILSRFFKNLREAKAEAEANISEANDDVSESASTIVSDATTYSDMSKESAITDSAYQPSAATTDMAFQPEKQNPAVSQEVVTTEALTSGTNNTDGMQ